MVVQFHYDMHIHTVMLLSLVSISKEVDPGLSLRAFADDHAII